MANRLAPMPYAVPCACGLRLEGLRKPTHQVRTCPACQRNVFILPRPALPGRAPRAERRRFRGHTNWWFYPTLAAVVTLVLIASVGVALLSTGWLTVAPPKPTTPPQTEISPTERLARAKQALSEGALFVARHELAGGKWTDRTSEQLQRQVDLLATLIDVPLADVCRHMIGLPTAEWTALFRERYQGRAVIFDAPLSRRADGQYELAYALHLEGTDIRLDWSALTLLRELPLAQPQRVVVGVRLAGVTRQVDGTWLILLDPTSGVLFTDADVFKATAVPVDPDLRITLKRQAQWLRLE